MTLCRDARPNGDTLYAIKPNGKIKWKYEMEDSFPYIDPIIGSDGIAINPEDGSELWRYQLIGTPNFIALEEGVLYTDVLGTILSLND